MKMAIIGSRNTGSVDFYDAMDRVMGYLSVIPTEVISGGAKGYDTLAAEWARARNIPVTEYLPDYNRDGRGAPFVRNRRIALEADVVVAFWDGRSRGTKYTLDFAKRRGKNIIIVDTNGNNIHTDY